MIQELCSPLAALTPFASEVLDASPLMLALFSLSSPRRPSWSRRSLLAALLLFGCSGGGYAPVIEGSGTDAEAGGPCEIGEERVCGVTLKQEAGVITCYEGHRECDDGAWSECLDGTVTERADPTAAGLRGILGVHAAALLPPNSTPERCLANPCDPHCYFYDENPTDITSTPTGLPSFPGTPAIVACAHDVCTVGARLTAGCHECVDDVCALQPSCCSTAWTSACADLAYETCASQPPPATLCDFAVFAENSLGFAGGSVRGGTLGAANAAGAGGNVLTVNSSNPIASIWADGNASLTNTTVTGHVTLGGATLTQSGSTLGSSRLSQDLSFTPIPTKTLSCLAVSGSLDVTSGRTVLAPNDARQINVNGAAAQVVLSAPGRYGAIHLNAAGTLVFASPGNYVLDQLVIGAANSTLLYPPSGRVEVDTCSALDFPASTISKRFTANEPCLGVPTYPRSSYSTGMVIQHNGVRYTCTQPGWCSIGGSYYEPGVGSAWTHAWTGGGSCAASYTNSGTNPAAYSTVFYTHDPAVTLGPGALQGGVLMAPTSTVSFHSSGGNGDLNGLVWARSVASTNTDVRIDATGLTGAACEAAALYVEQANSCPIRNVIPAVPPALVDPCGSGQDCQMNHRCVEPRTAGACAHSKCVRGAALDASCRSADFCVDRICDVDPTCCSGSWSQACVDKVATVCDATCGEAECSRDVCSTGPAQDFTCDSCVANVCAHEPSCCGTAWTRECVELVHELCSGARPTSTPIGSSICDYSAYGGQEVMAQGEDSSTRAFLYGGWVGSPNNGSMNVQYTHIDGNVTGSGSLNIDYSNITGNVVNGSGSFSGTGATVGGTTNAFPPAPVLPSRTFTCPGAAAPTGGSIAPGNYGNVVVPDGGTLTLSPGTYNFNSLRLGSGGAGATLALPSTGRVSINVCGRVDFRENSVMSGLTPSTAMNVDIYANNAIAAWGENQLFGFLHAAGTGTGPTPPDNASQTYRGCIWIGKDSTVYGLLIAEKRTDVRAATVDARNLSEACREAGLDPTIVGSSSRPGRLCAYAGYARADAQLGSSNTIVSGHLGAGSGLGAGASNRVFGNVYAHGNVTFTGASTYYGDVKSTAAVAGTSSVNGVRAGNVPDVPSPTWPALPPPDCSGGKPTGHLGDRTVTSGTTTLAPGSYGDVTLANTTALQLSAGTYHFGQLDFQATSRLLLPASGNVTIVACGRVLFGDGFTQTGLGAGADALRLRVYSYSNASADAAPAIAVGSGAGGLVSGVLIAPSGKIVLSASSRLRGLAWGNQLAFSGGGARIDATGITGSACEDADVDALPLCPVTLIPREPTESADCLPNHIGYEDATCPTYDLAADVPCGNVVPVCNHGRADFNGNLTIGYWPASDRQMSLEMPTVSPAGNCNGASLSIAAGNCVDVPCPIPAGTHTVLVDPTNTLAECGTGSYNRRLDNWTVADGRSCAGSRVIEYEYRGLCPNPDTSPRWGYLTWNTAAPGASRISFSAKTATSSAGLASATYAPLAVAASSPVDTTQCALTGPSPTCPVPVSTVLALGQNQGEYLALRIQLEPSGNDHPTLRDWILTYTCAFDQ